ncbi:hypothetical protein B0T19DRAFT_277865 [Cercophora scortea]|uniref:Uncharacterized protein n=1 Tax=Cercophora scortea TaxID=314031 RepID=A0AAE0M6T5_9PEZI|nr:hypothetical protein B0T19DRAFT_277865 [Cercophora scortea]
MCRPPSEQSLRAVLSTVLPPQASIDKVKVVPSLRLQRVYEVSLLASGLDSSDGALPCRMLLVLPPVSRLRLLRSEQRMVVAEAEVVRWVRMVLGSSTTAGVGGDRKMEVAGRKGGEERAEEQKKPLPKHHAAVSSSADDVEHDLIGFLPTVLHSSQGANELGSPFTLLHPTPGTPIALTRYKLTPPEREQVDRQLGQHHRRLSKLTSPSGRFGPVAAVLSARASASPPRQLLLHQQIGGGSRRGGSFGGGSGGGMMMGTGGAATWSMAFHSMLEGILRDGEDMAVAMQYTAIRRNFQRLGYVLDEVRVPRLVVIDGAEDANVLVTTEDEEEEEVDGKDGAAEGGKENDVKLQEDNSTITVTGLRDWSNSIFGDPLLASVFSEGPSKEFLEGFNGPTASTSTQIKPDPAGTPPNSTDGRATTPPTKGIGGLLLNLHHSSDDDFIDDIDNATVRLLFYQVYHATVCVVREFYRPRSESSRWELEARKRLTEALARLEEVAIDEMLVPKRRLRRGSGEMSPAKRFKSPGDD